MNDMQVGPICTIHAVDLREAAAWIADCEWADEINADSLTDRQIYSGIERHYDGGWAQFIRDARG